MIGFGDLKEGMIRQPVIRLNGSPEYALIQDAMKQYMEGSDAALRSIGGIDVLDWDLYDDAMFAIGDRDREFVIPGILVHDGEPVPGQIITYGRVLNDPDRKMGVWLGNGKVVSKWGYDGPLMKHEWYMFDSSALGKNILFSTFMSDINLAKYV